MNYARVLSHLSGPLASVIGVVSTVVMHSTVTHNAAVNTATFVTSTAATYLAHAKWFDNLAHWWLAHETPAEAPAPPPPPQTVIPMLPTSPGDAPSRVELAQQTLSLAQQRDALRKQLEAHGLTPDA